ncbi:MAG: sigma 54-interacting transcriptional regulator [Candidatus Latescibacteria bacterium]|nr:sigma 54-interacting transcriptional regulator [Candidatus Latescibacterota bacterium]
MLDSVWPRQGIWQSFGLAHGLPDMKVEGLCIDSRGVVWAGTHDKGVAFYDGSSFACLSRQEGLPGHGVYAIRSLGNGTVLLATDDGIARYANGGLECLDGDHGPVLWGCATHGDRIYFGLDRLSGEPPRIAICDENSVNVVELDDQPDARGMSVTAMTLAGDGNIWCGGTHLYSYDGKEFDRKDTPGDLGQIRVLCARETSSEIWGAADSGLFRIRDGEFEPLQGPETIQGMVESNAGDLWATGHDGNLYRARGSSLVTESNIGVPLWRGVVVDPEGRIWVGSYGYGLFCYDPTRMMIPVTARGGAGIASAAAVGSDGDLWIGSGSELIRSQNDLAPEVLTWPAEISSHAITALLVDSDGTLWIGKRNGTVFRIERSDITQCQTHDSIEGYGIRDLAQDNLGNVWFCLGYSDGFGYFDRSGTISMVSVPGGPSRVACVAPSSTGSIYLGVQRFGEWDGVWEYVDGEVHRVAGTQGVSANAMLEDEQGILWVGTSEGVLRLDNEFAVTYNMSDGLPSDLVTCLFEDSRGVLWIGTEGGGAACYDGGVFQTVRVPSNPALNSVVSVSQAVDDEIWFATNGGVVRYRQKRVLPTVEMLQVSADRDHLPRDGLQLPDTAGRVSISFRGLSRSVVSSDLVYRHRLVGLSDEWTQTRELEAEFVKLRPRNYRFELQAVDPDLNYSEVLAIDFDVTEDPRIGALTAALSDARHGEFIGESEALEEVRRQVREVGWTDLTVLILGETGTGKGLAARLVHELSERRNGPFIHVNCGALPSGLVDSELFGHDKGAFTGAISKKLGKFELAEGGSIFLDEIGDLPEESQTRLLRVLQDRCIERVGGATTIPIDVRVIAATNRDLTEAVRKAEYRADLFYRLNVFPITIPPLRARVEDISQLSNHFADTFSDHLNVPMPIMSESAQRALMEYGWPGNVRELEHTIQRAVLLARGGVIGREHLGMVSSDEAPQGDQGMIIPLSAYEKQYIERVLRITDGVIHGAKGAAKLLGMKPTTLRSRIEKLGVKRPLR